MAKVSIITRTKDRPHFLKRALDSVGSQTYADYEHLIFSDSDKTENIEALIGNLSTEQKKKTKFVTNSKPSDGPDTVFNLAIDQTNGEIIAIHDDDDTWHSEFLKYTVNRLEQLPEFGGVAVRTQKIIEKIDIQNNEIKFIKSLIWQENVKEISLYRQCAENQLTPISYIFRRSAYEKVGKFDVSLPVVGDWEFGIRLLLDYDVDFLDPGFALANYHHRKFDSKKEGNTSFAGNEKHRYYSNLVRNQYLRDEFKSGKFGPGYIMSKIRYEQNYIYRLFGGILPKSLSRLIKSKI